VCPLLCASAAAWHAAAAACEQLLLMPLLLPLLLLPDADDTIEAMVVMLDCCMRCRNVRQQHLTY
jgi:hypothetical protein